MTLLALSMCNAMCHEDTMTLLAFSMCNAMCHEDTMTLLAQYIYLNV